MKSLLFVGVLAAGLGVGSWLVMGLVPGIGRVDDSPEARRRQTIAGIRTEIDHYTGYPQFNEDVARLKKRLAELEGQ